MTLGSGGARAKVAALKTIGEFDCEIGALAKLAVGIGRLFADPPHLFECFDQPIKVLRQKLLAKSGVVARPREFVLGDQVAHRRGL
jgi:hypothetical protein